MPAGSASPPLWLIASFWLPFWMTCDSPLRAGLEHIRLVQRRLDDLGVVAIAGLAQGGGAGCACLRNVGIVVAAGLADSRGVAVAALGDIAGIVSAPRPARRISSAAAETGSEKKISSFRKLHLGKVAGLRPWGYAGDCAGVS